jgi:hypothetical protein
VHTVQKIKIEKKKKEIVDSSPISFFVAGFFFLFLRNMSFDLLPYKIKKEFTELIELTPH